MSIIHPAEADRALEDILPALSARADAILHHALPRASAAGLGSELRFILAGLLGRPIEPSPTAVPLPELASAVDALRHALLDQLADELGRDLRRDELLPLLARFDRIASDRLVAIAESRLEDLRLGSEAQGRYMSFLNHDLRGALNGVILMLEVLRRELVTDARFDESVQDILLMRKSILEAVAMMERHVQADRLRRGKMEIHPQEIDLRALADGALTQYAQQAAEKQLTLVNRIPHGARVWTDHDQLRLILANLLDNAVKYVNRGTITLSTERQADACILAIADQGPGMAPERLRQLLDPALRMNLKERGMGLILAYYAARALGGRLEGDSTPSHGSTFRVILPADPQPGQ